MTPQTLLIIEEALSGNWERKSFPVASCTIPNVREPEVLDSDETYLCLIVNLKHPDYAQLSRLHPYTCKVKRKLLYGWTDGNNATDHFERDIHGDDDVVVAWKLLPKEAS